MLQISPQVEKKKKGIPGRGPSSTKAWRQEGAHGRDFLMAELFRAGARALRTDSMGMRRDDQTPGGGGGSWVLFRSLQHISDLGEHPEV